MRARTRNRFLHASLIAAGVFAAMWFVPGSGSADWWVLIQVLLVAFALAMFAVWMCTTPTSPYQAPDVLGERFDPNACFDVEGLTFVYRFEVAEGMLWFELYYQNRFTGPCRAEIRVTPMEKLMEINLDFECPGGEVGVVRQPYPIEKNWQGKIMIFDVYAEASYPLRRGEQIRLERAGRRLSGTGDVGSAALSAALLLVGHVHIPEGPRGGKVEMRLPENVAEDYLPGIARRREILWQLDVDAEAMPA